MVMVFIQRDHQTVAAEITMTVEFGKDQDYKRWSPNRVCDLETITIKNCDYKFNRAQL